MRLSFDRLWVVIALALPALLALLVPLPAVDLAYQVRAGDEILATRALPAVDTWTFTVAGTPWLDQQWLAQLLLSLGYGIGGWELLAVLRAVLVVGALGFLLAACVARGAPVNVAAILTLVAFLLAAPALALRPQLFAIVVLAALLWLVSVRERRATLYLVAPVLVVLWANLHGSFVLAPLVLGYAVVDDIARRRPAGGSLLVLGLGALATLVTPFGIAAWSYAIGIGTNPTIADQVSEWQRTSPTTIPGALYYASVVAVAALLVVRRRDREHVTAADWLWVIGWAAIAAWTVRGLAWWPLAAAFAVAPVVLPARMPADAEATSPGRRRPRPNRVNALVAVLLGVLVAAALPWWRPVDPLTGREGLLTYAPSGLAQALRDTLPAGSAVLSQQAWASWFEWAAPGSRYYLDSRFELFPEPVFTDYAVVLAGGEAALEVLDRWAVDAVAVAPDEPIVATLRAAGWTESYVDVEGLLLDRPEGPR